MGKDANGKGKGKGKTRAKAENVPLKNKTVKESTDSLRNTLNAEMSSLG